MLLKKVYGDECLSRTQVFESFRRFCYDQKYLNDGERSDRSRTTRTPEMIEKVCQKISTYENVSIRLLTDEPKYVKIRFVIL